MGQICGFLEEVQANRQSANDRALIERSAMGKLCLERGSPPLDGTGYVLHNWCPYRSMSRSIRCNIVSELGIEKVVVELNSFRQRTAMIKEEIAKVSRALNERAGQLNDLVNKSLGQLKEQLGGTTLSGYLSLQGRYQSGDMNDQDYTQQKDYYRGELQNMIRKLDESKKLMMIMAQLDSQRPGAQAPQGQPRPQPTQSTVSRI